MSGFTKLIRRASQAAGVAIVLLSALACARQPVATQVAPQLGTALRACPPASAQQTEAEAQCAPTQEIPASSRESNSRSSSIAQRPEREWTLPPRWNFPVRDML